MSIPAHHVPRREFPWGLAALVPIVVMGVSLLTLAAEPDMVLHFIPHVAKVSRIDSRLQRIRRHLARYAHRAHAADPSHDSPRPTTPMADIAD